MTLVKSFIIIKIAMAVDSYTLLTTRLKKIIRRLRLMKSAAAYGGLQRRLEALLSHDALYNVHKLAYDSNFIHRIVTYPDLSVICYNLHLVHVDYAVFIHWPRQAHCHCNVRHEVQLGRLLRLGSTVLFRETEFDSSPIVPLAFRLHERKLQSTHDEFFSHIRKLCPQLDNAVNIVI